MYIDNMTATAINATGDIPSPRMYPVLAPLGNACILLYGGEPTSSDEKWDPNFYTLNLGKLCTCLSWIAFTQVSFSDTHVGSCSDKGWSSSS